MSTVSQKRADELKRAFQESLDRHGYPLQYSVLARLEELRGSAKSKWALESTEFPVEVPGHPHPTRIDFVLRDQRSLGTSGLSTHYMLAECKRANPEYCDWCFVRAPYTREKPYEGYIVLDTLDIQADNTVIARSSERYLGQIGAKEHPTYHHGIEIKGRKADDNAKREGSDPNKSDEIEKAVTQVLLGLNGMIEFIALHPDLYGTRVRLVTFLPVIFTTARLWVSAVDLRAASLVSGNVDLSGSDFYETPWLLYQYSLSPGLKHKQQLQKRDSWYESLAPIVWQDYVRTVAIVNTSQGVEKFIAWSSLIPDVD